MKLSDYNNLNKMTEKQCVNLGNDKYLLIENIMCRYWTGNLSFEADIQPFLTNNAAVEINNVKLFPLNFKQNIEMFDFQCVHNNIRFTDYVVVVPDHLINTDQPCISTFSAIYKDNKKEVEEQIVSALLATYDGRSNTTLYTNEKDQIITTTANFFEENIKFSRLYMLYFVSYVGSIGLIIALSIFMLMCILEVINNTSNYNILIKLGTSDKSICHAVFKQITSYFFILSTFITINITFYFLLFSKYRHLFNQTKILRHAIYKTVIPIFILFFVCYIIVCCVCKYILSKSVGQGKSQRN